MTNTTTTVVQEQPVSAVQPPQGVPAGGVWIEDKFCGPMSWLICVVTGCCCIKCMCPCDRRTVYVVNNTKYNQMGAIVTD